jgi:diacylglycerol kinase (ATP)
MPSYTRIAIIYNPKSTGHGEERARELHAFLTSALKNNRIELIATKRAGHGTQLAYRLARKHRSPLIISSSGDGGYHDVINGALQAQDEGATPICAVFPAGNANDHARTLHTDRLEKLILRDKPENIDILKTTITYRRKQTVLYAHSYVGLGLTPAVAAELNKHDLNAFWESFVVVKSFFKNRPVRLLIGGKRQSFDSLICSTIPGMAKLLKLKSSGKPVNGQFQVFTYEHRHRVRLMLHMLLGMFRPIGESSRTTSLTFRTLSQTQMQLDGEVKKLRRGANVTVSIAERQLRTLL